MAPHLVRWQQEFSARGFTVAYVTDGAREGLSAAQTRIQAENLPYPLFVDERSSATRAYGVRAFPTAYILDRSGRVIWEGIPVFNPSAVAEAIQAAL